jgi:hypothetical protein
LPEFAETAGYDGTAIGEQIVGAAESEKLPLLCIETPIEEKIRQLPKTPANR